MPARRPKRTQGLVLFAVLAGCAGIPQVAFTGDDSGATGPSGINPPVGPPEGGPSLDAGGPSVDGGSGDGAADAGGGDDAGDDDADAGAIDQPGDDGGATILCGTTLVSDCSSCDAGILRCKTTKVDRCVSDCTACALAREPCIHCPAQGGPRGTCLPVGPDGQIKGCNFSQLCPCKTASDCPAIAHSAETCDQADGGKRGCVTCGSPTTSGLACFEPGETAPGICGIDAGVVPTCN